MWPTTRCILELRHDDAEKDRDAEDRRCSRNLMNYIRTDGLASEALDHLAPSLSHTFSRGIAVRSLITCRMLAAILESRFSSVGVNPEYSLLSLGCARKPAPFSQARLTE